MQRTTFYLILDFGKPYLIVCFMICYWFLFTVSFYIKCNKNGTYNVELMDNDNSNRHVSKTYTVSNNNWTRHTITFPADTTGAFNNDNGNSMHLYFWLAAGGQFITGSRQETWGALNQGGRAPGLSLIHI